MKLSIITINLNNLRGLKKTMDSILSQTSRDYEWIVIDGGSTDGSRELIEQNAEHIAYWVSEPDSGIYNAMNKGIDAATGDYYWFLNSGDCIAAPDVVKSFTVTPPIGAKIIYGNAIVIDHEDKILRNSMPPDNISLTWFYHHCLLHQAILFNKSCFKHLRYSEHYRYAADYELCIRLLLYGYSYKKWEKCMVRFDGEGLTAQNRAAVRIEFNQIWRDVIPQGVKSDIDEVMQFREVDLYITIRAIIASKRWVRNMARLVLHPFQIFLTRKI